MATLSLSLWSGGCGLFGSDEAVEAPQAPAAEEEATETEPEPVLPGGVLRNIVKDAPPASAPQYLALLADQFGWEQEVAQNEMLAQAIEGGDFEGQVEPFLLALFFQHGFSVLPRVGEGHQFSRDTVVRGLLGSARYLVTTRNQVRIVLLQPVRNVEIVYPKDGAQPQIFSIDRESVISIRASRLDHYLR